MFLQASVCPQGVSASVHAGIPHHPQKQTDTPLEADTPPGSRCPLEADTHPHSRHPLGADTPPPGADTPRADTTPPTEQTSPCPPEQTSPQSRHPPRYGHCCGWYTSYWNAFLFLLRVTLYFYSHKLWFMPVLGKTGDYVIDCKAYSSFEINFTELYLTGSSTSF